MYSPFPCKSYDIELKNVVQNINDDDEHSIGDPLDVDDGADDDSALMIAERSLEDSISLDVEHQIQRSKKAAFDVDYPEPKRRKLVKDVAGTYS